MHIIVVGLNYRTAPVEVRERFTLAEEQLPVALEKLQATTSVMECVIVATCNRTEIYAVVDRAQICGHYINSFIEEWFQLKREQFTNCLYMYEDKQAIEHLFKVTCGLDSMIIGETQILGQVRDAFFQAQNKKATGTVFNKLFKSAITVAKRAHTETKIGEMAVSVSYAAVELGKRIFGQFSNKKVLIFGAGATSELTIKHLYANGAAEIYVVNRTLENAQELAAKFNGKACEIKHAKKLIGIVDVIISSTSAQDYVLTFEEVHTAMAVRRTKPLFIIDIAVPRDFDPAISQLDNVFLYDIDDLQDIVNANLVLRKQEAKKIEGFIAEEQSEFEQWYNTLGMVPIIQALQNKASSIHEKTMNSMLNKLPNLSEQEQKVIRKLTKSMLNQMLQDPLMKVKEMVGQCKADEAMDLFVEIFGLNTQLAMLEQEQKEEIAMNKRTTHEEGHPVHSAKKIAALG